MISAIILAGGESKRMRQPKMLLPWGKLTVIEQVISTFLNSGLEYILVVTGGAKEQVETAIKAYPVQMIHNRDYVNGEMLSSLQCGLRALPDRVQATLVGLGDQPQVQEGSIRLVCETYKVTQAKLVVPSFQMRRGHPWLVERFLWKEILDLKSTESPRDFLTRHAEEIRYVNLDTPTILSDLDTPEDYQNARP